MTTSHTDGEQRSLGTRLKERRLELGLSRERLAAKAGVSSSLIIRVERHGQVPRADRLVALADALGLPISELFGGRAA